MVKLMDCTLRDGANVVGTGFSAELTRLMLDGLLRSNIRVIEYGCAYGIGAKTDAPLSDEAYMELAAPYRGRAELGMFLSYFNGTRETVEMGARGGLDFLRVGANAGDAAAARGAVERVKEAGLTCRYAMMKGYILPPEQLAQEAALLESYGVDEVTLMDSAGTMTPDEVTAYIRALTAAVSVPVAFHGHNNLGLSAANALAAAAAGARVLDCGLMGMARSAGNLATEVAAAVFRRQGQLLDVDLFALLHFIEEELAPAMRVHHYQSPISALDLVYGLSGCHSSFAGLFEAAAKQYGVDLFRLIVEVSAIDRKAPGEALIRQIASGLR